MFIAHFEVFCDLLLNRRTATWNLFVLYNKTNYYTKRLFISKYCSYTKWSNLTGCYARQRIVICREKSLTGSHCEIWLEGRSSWNENLQRKQIELRNLQILKKQQEKSRQFLSSEQPCEPKSLEVALKITGVEKNTLGKLVVTANLEAIWFEFWMKGA